jgi:hypothetical protein
MYLLHIPTVRPAGLGIVLPQMPISPRTTLDQSNKSWWNHLEMYISGYSDLVKTLVDSSGGTPQPQELSFNLKKQPTKQKNCT